MNIIFEAILAGLMVILFGWIASFLVRPYFQVSLPEICASWNRKHVMEITLFLTGALGWLVLKPVFKIRTSN
jgi:hypothetical protein